MMLTCLQIAFGFISIACLLNLWALVRRPHMAERVLALDTLFINAIALVLVYGLLVHNQQAFELALLIALLGFVSTVALCRYLLRGDIIE